ncbi:hypothetical protein BLNAU_22505 [Blattamonas nauphoetae]|uniref:Uncharacterized protein n=1 Tax=Blattamonas nauphoetae TaxID=2049346 RepID=A0ABQ9WTD5_9EUKA|nr:hypothetical protein BLNAU_22505 [Blattamonas nauphoetae]
MNCARIRCDQPDLTNVQPPSSAASRSPAVLVLAQTSPSHISLVPVRLSNISSLLVLLSPCRTRNHIRNNTRRFRVDSQSLTLPTGDTIPAQNPHHAGRLAGGNPQFTDNARKSKSGQEIDESSDSVDSEQLDGLGASDDSNSDADVSEAGRERLSETENDQDDPESASSSSSNTSNAESDEDEEGMQKDEPESSEESSIRHKPRKSKKDAEEQTRLESPSPTISAPPTPLTTTGMHLDLIPSSSDNPSLKGNEGEGQFVDQPDEEFRMIDEKFQFETFSSFFNAFFKQSQEVFGVPSIFFILSPLLRQVTSHRLLSPITHTLVINIDRTWKQKVEEQAEERDVKAEEPTIKKDPAKMEQTAEQAISSNTSPHTSNHHSSQSHVLTLPTPHSHPLPALYEFFVGGCVYPVVLSLPPSIRRLHKRFDNNHFSSRFLFDLGAVVCQLEETLLDDVRYVTFLRLDIDTSHLPPSHHLTQPLPRLSSQSLQP